MPEPIDPAPRWPLSSHHEELVRELARMLALGGAWRFLRGPVVAASARDYPEPWDQTRDGLARVIARTFWHAHVDPEVVLEDARRPSEISRMLEDAERAATAAD